MAIENYICEACNHLDVCKVFSFMKVSPCKVNLTFQVISRVIVLCAESTGKVSLLYVSSGALRGTSSD